ADFSTYLTNALVKKLAFFEGIDMEEIQKEAEEDAQAAIDAGQEYYIVYYYGSVENYIRQIIPYKALNTLCKSRIEEDFDGYVSRYQPYKAEIVYFDDLEAATAVKEAVDSGENTFAYACAENGYNGIVTETVYTADDSNLPVEVKDYVAANAAGLSPIIETSTTITDSEGNSVINPRYYLVNLISKDVEDFRDEFMDLVVTDVDSNEVISGLLEKYEVSIHDQRAYDLLTATYEVLK
ncbi:MAG: hypothetical protein IKE38_05495, partial [Erysipelotrichaceae bacterium]|nr:hypothetical protein [Erysipelotrichaceae bacterium]